MQRSASGRRWISEIGHLLVALAFVWVSGASLVLASWHADNETPPGMVAVGSDPSTPDNDRFKVESGSIVAYAKFKCSPCPNCGPGNLPQVNSRVNVYFTGLDPDLYLHIWHGPLVHVCQCPTNSTPLPISPPDDPGVLAQIAHMKVSALVNCSCCAGGVWTWNGTQDEEFYERDYIEFETTRESS